MRAPSSSAAGRRRHLLLDTSIVFFIAAVSLAALTFPHHDYFFVQPFADSFAAILPHTAWAACKVWTFWTVAAAILAGILLRIEPALGLLDAVIGGFTGVWVFAYVGGNALGPIGLFLSWTIWAVLAAGALWLWRAGPPKIEVRAPSTGQKLALLTFALVAPTLLALQLGSPVAPYMDVLATPAAAQRILTFGRYLPFDNDPYGYWDAASQCPGVELFYALLGLGSGTSLGVLAQTAAIVPMAGLLILSTYRLGRTIGGDVAGGMAALLLFATVFFRALPYMHGRFVTFALVGAGLGFVLDERRNQIRLALGALVLGTAVASHAIIGGLAMVVASAPILFWLLSGNVVSALGGLGLMAGAAMIALPEVAIGLRFALPYPVLPLTQILGVALVWVSARGLHGRVVSDRVLARLPRWGLTLLVVVALAWHPPKLEVLHDHLSRFPLLFAAGSLGLALMLWLDIRRPSRVQLGPIMIALLLGISLDYVSRQWWTSFTDPKVQTAVEDFYHKIDYWLPYVLLFPGACLVAWVHRTLSRRVALFALLALLFFPWKEYADPNYHQHSIAESWAYQLELAKGGYWGSTGDRRWAQSPAELELAEVLRGEVAAGRITPATHIVHLTPFVILFHDNVLFSVYTGINDDPYVADYKLDRSIAGGRMRPIEQVYARLAQRPPYVVIHDDPDPLAAAALEGYDRLFDRDGVRLLRERALGPAEAQTEG